VQTRSPSKIVDANQVQYMKKFKYFDNEELAIVLCVMTFHECICIIMYITNVVCKVNKHKLPPHKKCLIVLENYLTKGLMKKLTNYHL